MSSEQILRKVKVEGGYLRFSSAHFITFGGKCERLHGHNYGVLVDVEGTLNEDKLVIDFTVLKRLNVHPFLHVRAPLSSPWPSHRANARY